MIQLSRVVGGSSRKKTERPKIGLLLLLVLLVLLVLASTLGHPTTHSKKLCAIELQKMRNTEVR